MSIHCVQLIRKLKISLNKKIEDDSHQCNNTQPTSYFQLPYLGDISTSTKDTLAKTSKKGYTCQFYFNETNVSLISKSFKVSEFFPFKTKIPEYLRSFIVCEFVYAGCNTTFSEQTQRRTKTRIDDHFRLDKKSYVFQHLPRNESCECRCDEICFKVIDITYSDFRLKLKRGTTYKMGKTNTKW